MLTEIISLDRPGCCFHKYTGVWILFEGFDVTNRSSFEECQWQLEEAQRFLEDKCLIVGVGNKIDLEDQRVVSTEEARDFFEKNGVKYFEVSAKTGQGVHELIEATIGLWCEKDKEHMEKSMSWENDNETWNGKIVLRPDFTQKEEKEKKCAIM